MFYYLKLQISLTKPYVKNLQFPALNKYWSILNKLTKFDNIIFGASKLHKFWNI